MHQLSSSRVFRQQLARVELLLLLLLMGKLYPTLVYSTYSIEQGEQTRQTKVTAEG